MGKAKRIMRQRLAEENAYQLTSRQEQILQKGVHQAIMKEDDRYWLDMDAAVMMALSVGYGWRRKRLLRFYEDFYRIHEGWRRWYGLDNTGEDKSFLAWRYLEQMGITKDFLKEYGDNLYKKYIKDGADCGEVR